MLENKFEKKYNLERGVSKIREVKVFLEPSLFNHYIVIFFPAACNTSTIPLHTRMHTHTLRTRATALNFIGKI